MDIAQAGVNICIFPDGSDVRQVLDAFMTEPQEALKYKRHRRRTRVLKVEEEEDVVRHMQ